MKDLLLCVRVVVKTLNLEISRCHLQITPKNLTEMRAEGAAGFFFLSTNQVIIFWSRGNCCRRPCLSSLLTLKRPGVVNFVVSFLNRNGTIIC